ncbi:hypothetical protein [Dictyobacter formicarum]|nr:hypothetical protein [Dictyobacter formicarum]
MKQPIQSTSANERKPVVYKLHGTARIENITHTKQEIGTNIDILRSRINEVLDPAPEVEPNPYVTELESYAYDVYKQRYGEPKSGFLKKRKRILTSKIGTPQEPDQYIVEFNTRIGKRTSKKNNEKNNENKLLVDIYTQYLKKNISHYETYNVDTPELRVYLYENTGKIAKIALVQHSAGDSSNVPDAAHFDFSPFVIDANNKHKNIYSDPIIADSSRMQSDEEKKDLDDLLQKARKTSFSNLYYSGATAVVLDLGDVMHMPQIEFWSGRSLFSEKHSLKPKTIYTFDPNQGDHGKFTLLKINGLNYRYQKEYVEKFHPDLDYFVNCLKGMLHLIPIDISELENKKDSNPQAQAEHLSPEISAGKEDEYSNDTQILEGQPKFDPQTLSNSGDLNPQLSYSDRNPNDTITEAQIEEELKKIEEQYPSYSQGYTGAQSPASQEYKGPNAWKYDH